MKQSRSELEKFLEKRLKTKTSVNEIREICEELYNTYNIPISTSSDYVSLRTTGEELSEFILFAVLSVIKNDAVDEFFTKEEINAYKKTKIKKQGKIKFPLRIPNIVKVSQDQFIGATTVVDILKLRNWNLIDYNENSQRVMKKIVTEGGTFFQIMLNKIAVKAIRTLMEKGFYIPNTITFNIPEDTDFYYDEDENELVFKNLEKLDILDGYHRYIAMSQIYDINKNFNYPMEIRFVCFAESKAKQFIFQEDQKTKMKKADSNSFNQYNPASIIIERLNTESTSEICGMLNRSSKFMSVSDFTLFVTEFWFKNINKANEKQITRDVYKKIKECINLICENDDTFLNKELNTKRTAELLYAIYISDIENVHNTYLKLNGCLDNFNGVIISNGKVRKAVISELKNRYEVGD